MATGTIQLNGYDDNLGELVLTSRPGWATLILPLIVAVVLLSFPYLERLEQRQSASHISPSNEAWLIGVIVALVAVMLACSVIVVLILRIDIYEKGIAWRGFKGRRQALWLEVSDYYIHHTRNRTSHIVETSKGSKLTFSNFSIAWTNYKQLPEEIQKRAIPTKNMPWEEKGGRIVDAAPVVFRYNKIDAAVMLLIPLLATIAVTWQAVDLKLPLRIIETFELLGVWWGVGLVFLLLPMLGYPVLLVGFFSSAALAVMSYLNDRLEITRESIIIHCASGPRTYGWHDVTDLRLVRSGKLSYMRNLVIHFADGSQYPVFSLLANLTAFRRRVEALSGKIFRDPGDDASDDLGNEADRWSSGVVGLGSRRFHYRTRTSRAMSLLLLTFGVLPLIVHHIRPEKGVAEAYIISLIFLPVYLYCMWRYWKAAILVDETGITQLAPFGLIIIRWDEIEAVRCISAHLLSHYRIDAKGKKIRIYGSLSHLSDLLNLLREKGHSVDGS